MGEWLMVLAYLPWIRFHEKRRSLGVGQFIHFVADADSTSLRAVEIRISGGRLEVAVRGAVGGFHWVHNL
jgi:hypothetical protein